MAYGPPVRAPRPRAHARGTVAFPLIGLFLVVLGGFAVPWFGGDPTTGGDQTVRSLGIAAFFGVQVMLLVPSILVAFAGTLDSPVCRVLYAILGVLGGLTLLVGGLVAGGMATSVKDGVHDTVGVSEGAAVGVVVAAGVVTMGWSILFAFLRGVGCRIVSGLMLLGTAVSLAVAGAGLSGYSTAASGGVLLAAFGYLLCSIGAFAGPRYDRLPFGPAGPMVDPMFLPPGRL